MVNRNESAMLASLLSMSPPLLERGWYGIGSGEQGPTGRLLVRIGQRSSSTSRGMLLCLLTFWQTSGSMSLQSGRSPLLALDTRVGAASIAMIDANVRRLPRAAEEP